MRYEVYTLRRTSTRTVYAVYDKLRTQPVCKPRSDAPLTTTDRYVAQKWARELNLEGRLTVPNIAVSFEADYLLDADLGPAPDEDEIVQTIQTELGFSGVKVTELISWGWVND